MIGAAIILQPVQSEILKSGSLILGADPVAAWGFPTSGGWVVNRKCGQAHSVEVVSFLKAAEMVAATKG